MRLYLYAREYRKYFRGIIFRILAKFSREFMSVPIHVAPICTRANTGRNSWRIIYVLISCQGVLIEPQFSDILNRLSNAPTSLPPFLLSFYQRHFRGVGGRFDVFGVTSSEKWGEKTNTLPGPTPESRAKLPENCKNGIFGVIFPLLRAFFPNFGGRTGEGNFVILPHEAFRPRGFPGPLRGKTTHKSGGLKEGESTKNRLDLA